MRIFLLSKADIYGNLILNRLLPLLSGRHEAHVYLSDYTMPDERGTPWADAYTFAVRDYPVETFFPALDRAASEVRGAELLSFAALSARHGVPFTELGGVPSRAKTLLAGAASALRPDLLLCCRHDYIIPKEIFTKIPHGSYNFHSAELPAYRGPFCMFWAMHRRDREGACSIHALESSIDTGAVVGMGRTRIDYSLPLLSNLADVYMSGVEVFAELLPALELGPLPGIPQPPDAGAYYRQPNADDCAAFIAGGGRFVDADAYNALLGRYLRGVPLKNIVGENMPVRNCDEYRTDKTA
jgi:hypothetical protein